MKFSELNLIEVGHSIQMVGAVYSDDERLYLCFFPGEHELEPRTKLTPIDMTQEDWTAFLRQTDLLETEILAKETPESKVLYKAIVRKSQRSIDQNVSWRVFKRDSYKCRYCGNDSVPLTVDHLIVWEFGGPSIEANLVSSCKKDNKVRGNLPYAEWLKHPHYLRVSKNLSEEGRRANEAAVAILSSIPLNIQIKSR